MLSEGKLEELEKVAREANPAVLTMANARYRQDFDPDTVLALISDFHALRAEVHDLERCESVGECLMWKHRYEAAAAELAALRAQAPAEFCGDEPSRAREGEAADLTTPYRPVAIHYTVPDYLEYVRRDTPTCVKPVAPDIDLLLDLTSREPIGWRIYGWSAKAPASQKATLDGSSHKDDRAQAPAPVGGEVVEAANKTFVAVQVGDDVVIFSPDPTEGGEDE